MLSKIENAMCNKVFYRYLFVSPTVSTFLMCDEEQDV